jgi:fluoride ion exporter CrcB/FEX
MEYLYIILGGLGGGIVRGLIGYIKHQFSYKQVDFKLPYFFVIIFLSGIIGTLCAAAIDRSGITNTIITPALAFVIGYAGGDFLDNIYKIIIKKKDAI